MTDDADGVVEPIAGGWIIRFERRLRHSPAKVWMAITEPGRMSQWFDRTEFPAAPEPGGIIRFFHDKVGLQSRGRILAADPPRLIEWEWTSDFSTPSICRWEIRPEGEGCVLVMSQTTDEPGVIARTTAGWHACLERLQNALDGRPQDQDLERDWKPRFARYALRFADLARDAQIKREGQGVEARFDRTLPHPAEAIWAQFLTLGKTVDARVGGQVRFAPEPGHPPSSAEIAAFDPPRRLEARWSDGAFFRLELLDLGGAAQLTLTFFEPNGGPRAAQHIARWHEQLDHLADRLDGKPDARTDLGASAQRYQDKGV